MMSGLDARRSAHALLRDEIIDRCQDVRDGITAGWCGAALRLYGREGLAIMADEAADRGDWSTHRRLIARLMVAERETSQ